MASNLSVYNLGILGVNLVDGPIHMKDGELLQCQNAMAMPTEAQIALVKRPGLDLIATGNGAILNMISFLHQSFQGHGAAQLGTGWVSMRWAASLGLFCAVNASGANRVLTSDDAVTWTPRVASAQLSWSAVEWSAALSLFCAVASGSTGGTGKVMTSPDGINWTTRNFADADADWSGIAWSPTLGLFAAVSETGTVPTPINTSPDGINWTTRAGTLGGWRKIIWAAGPALFIAMGFRSTAQARFGTSPNGTAWSQQLTTINTVFNDAVWVPALSLVVAVGSGPGPTHSVATSPDGITWTGVTVPGNPDLWSVEYSSDLALLVAQGSESYWLSRDGVHWWEAAGSTIGLGSRGSDLAWSSTLELFGVAGSGGVEAFSQV